MARHGDADHRKKLVEEALPFIALAADATRLAATAQFVADRRRRDGRLKHA
jgi:hypothetical protein